MRLTHYTATFLFAMATPLAAEVPRVVADTPVTHSLVAQVMGNLGAPELLLTQGSDPHHAQLRPSQARAVSRADLVAWTSADLSPWLVDVIAALAPDAALELAGVPGLHRQPFADSVLLPDPDAHDDDHDDHEHDHGHGHDDIDPHLWLDPENAQIWLAAIAAHLGNLDPENSVIYTENATRAQARITELSRDVAAILEPARDVGLVMAHDAYGYFAAHFGLTVLGSVAAGDAVDPSAARISTLRAALEAADATCLFPEVNHADAYVRLVAEGGTLRIGAPLDPAGMMLEPGPGLYADLLTGLASAITACAAE